MISSGASDVYPSSFPVSADELGTSKVGAADHLGTSKAIVEKSLSRVEKSLSRGEADELGTSKVGVEKSFSRGEPMVLISERGGVEIATSGEEASKGENAV